MHPAAPPLPTGLRRKGIEGGKNFEKMGRRGRGVRERLRERERERETCVIVWIL